METISPLELRELILGDREFALIDVREQGAFSESHLLFAVCVPQSRLELLIGDLVPRNGTCVVVVDGGDGDDVGERGLAFLRADLQGEAGAELSPRTGVGRTVRRAGDSLDRLRRRREIRSGDGRGPEPRRVLDPETGAVRTIESVGASQAR